MSLTWDISGGLGRHDNAVPGKHRWFPSPKGGQRWASVPCGSAAGLAEGRASLERFWIFLRSPHGRVTGRDCDTDHQKNKGWGESVSQREAQNTPGELWSADPSREGSAGFRDTPRRKWFSSEYLLGLKYAKPVWIHNTHRKNFPVDALHDSYISEQSLTEDRRRNRKEERSMLQEAGVPLCFVTYYILSLELIGAMNECSSHSPCPECRFLSIAKSTKGRGFISQMRLSLQLKGVIRLSSTRKSEDLLEFWLKTGDKLSPLNTF